MIQCGYFGTDENLSVLKEVSSAANEIDRDVLSSQNPCPIYDVLRLLANTGEWPNKVKRSVSCILPTRPRNR